MRSVVGKEGKLGKRGSLGEVTGFWRDSIDSVNTLIDDLVHPTSETARVIGAVAQGFVVIDPNFASALFPTRESTPQPVEELTPRELQVLLLMAEGQSNK